jgi:hypothetical protein
MSSADRVRTGIPNFLIIGAPRCGTTTLYRNLMRHPQIFMSPVKEPMFFIFSGGEKIPSGSLVKDHVTQWDQYQALFEGSQNAKAIGEASTFYLYNERAAEKISTLLPNVKLIAILRNPVDRAYSHFLINRLRGIEPLRDFTEALAEEKKRMQSGWFMFFHYQMVGFYGEQLARYLARFPQERMLILLFDEFCRNPEGTYRGIFRFLDVSEKVTVPTGARYNISGVPRNRWWHDFLSKPNPAKWLVKKILSQSMQEKMMTRFTVQNITKPALDADIRRRLTDLYREDMHQTQEMIKMDLSKWLTE